MGLTATEEARIMVNTWHAGGGVTQRKPAQICADARAELDNVKANEGFGM